LTPVEVDSVAGDTITAPVPDAEGTNPQFLILNGRVDTIDTSQFSNLHAIVEANNAFTNDALTVTGSHSESIYLGDLNGDFYNNGFDLFLSDSGNDHVYGGG